MRTEEWLVIEWPLAETEPIKYWLMTLPARVRLAEAAAGAELVLLGFPPFFYPSSYDEVYDYAKALCDATNLAVMLLAVPTWGFGRLHPFIVFDDADVEAAVKGALLAKYRHPGQACVAANRMLVQAGIYDAFAKRLAEESAALKVGNGIDAGVVQGPLINEEAVAKVEEHIADALAKGAVVAAGGKRHALGDFSSSPQC